jgi:hypothetical protein
MGMGRGVCLWSLRGWRCCDCSFGVFWCGEGVGGVEDVFTMTFGE